MKTAQALDLAGSKIKLAAILGVTRQAIQQYGEELPAERTEILQRVKPEWFAASAPQAEQAAG